MGDALKSWELRQGDRRIGTLIFESQDMFWSDCRFVPGPGWAGMKPLFDRSRAAWLSDDTGAAIAADEAVHAAGLVLEPTDGSASITDFLLQINGDEARFRW